MNSGLISTLSPLKKLLRLHAHKNCVYSYYIWCCTLNKQLYYSFFNYFLNTSKQLPLIYMKNFHVPLSKTYFEHNTTLLYLDYLLNKYDHETVAVQAHDAYRFQGNLFGLFSYMRIEKENHVYAMYINGYTNPNQYDGIRTSFKVPNYKMIEMLKSIA